MSRSTFHSEGDLSVAFDTYADALFRHCYFRTFNRELGKQLMLDTFRGTWQFIAEGNYIDDMKLYLYRTANLLIAGVRTDVVAASVDASEDAVVTTLRQLPTEDRDAFVLRHIDGLSAAEAASVLGESEGALNHRVDRCMDRIATLASR